MNKLVWLAAIAICCLSTAVGSSADFEVPQIHTVSGVSLSYSREAIDDRLGSPVEVLPPTPVNRTWEFRYKNGLKASFKDREPTSRPILLTGPQLSVRGRPIDSGATYRQIEETLGTPTGDTRLLWSYTDTVRQVAICVRFSDGRVVSFAVSRSQETDSFCMPSKRRSG